ncbi:SERTA domain-containing protein 3 [Paramarasmius palmivorus]|uniref:SERTA domain-containing protein 3 n=1 Tax=Paramarasmius palmivorus TaxID=297713 RepID=A0AAW0BDW5_9AGAR
MVAHSSFEGSRAVFLDSHHDSYAVAAQEGWIKDFIADLGRRYMKRYPASLAHNVEPSEEHLQSVNDDAPDPESLCPVQRPGQSDEEYHQAVRKHEIEKDITSFRLGVSRVTIRILGRKAFVRVRQEVVKEVYDALSELEKKPWEEAVEKDWSARLEAYKASMNAGFSTEPAARQDCITRLPAFVQPILDGIRDATGMHCTLIVGGPEPADMGRLNMVSFHSGETLSLPALNFGAACQEGYRNLLIPLYGSYLRKCFTVEECKSRALPQKGLSLAACLAGEAGINLDFIDTPGIPRDEAAVPSSDRSPPSQQINVTGSTSTPEKTVKAAEKPSHGVATLQVSSVPNGYHQSPPPTPPPVSPLRETTAPVHGSSSPCSSPAPGSAPPTLAPSTPPRGSSLFLYGSPVGSIQTEDLGLPVEEEGEETALDQPQPSLGASSGGDLVSNSGHGKKMQRPESVKRKASSQRGVDSSSAYSGANSLPGIENVTSPETPTVTTKSKRRTSRAAPKPTPITSSAASASNATSAVSGSNTAKRSTKRKAVGPPLAHPQRDQKRSKVAKSQTTLIACPDQAPTYVWNLFSMASTVGMNQRFYQILQRYLALEEEHGYQGGNLKTKNRPDEVQQWYKRRRAVWFPEFTDIAHFSQEFKAWFRLCSPPWRTGKENGAVMIRKSGEEWGCMRVLGQNGIVAFLVSLVWWQKALNNLSSNKAKDLAEHQSRLEEVFAEVEYTFQNL